MAGAGRSCRSRGTVRCKLLPLSNRLDATRNFREPEQDRKDWILSKRCGLGFSAWRQNRPMSNQRKEGQRLLQSLDLPVALPPDTSVGPDWRSQADSSRRKLPHPYCCAAVMVPNTPRRSQNEGGFEDSALLRVDAAQPGFRSAAIRLDRRYRIA